MSSTCTYQDRGDPFDAMGFGMGYASSLGSLHEYSGLGKLRVGWLGESNVKTLDAPGTYTVSLAPTELATSQVQLLKVKRGSDYFYVDYRQPGSAFDTSAGNTTMFKGVSIRLAHATPAGLVNPILLDMTPKTSSFLDATLKAGATFTDPSSGVSIKLVNVSGTAAQVQVTLTTVSSSLDASVGFQD